MLLLSFIPYGVMSIPCSPKQIGLILLEAQLITPGQLEVALHERQYFEMLLGEILSKHGWIRQETADFFADSWPLLVNGTIRHPLGHYLQLAHLLDEEQVHDILMEQRQLGVRFGAVAVLKGWVKQETVDYFLKNLAPHELTQSAFKTQSSRSTQEHRKTNSTFLQRSKTTQRQNSLYIPHRNTEHPTKKIITSSVDANDTKFDLGNAMDELDEILAAVHKVHGGNSGKETSNKATPDHHNFEIPWVD
ncbi:MAG: hypothetical protein ACO36E_06475 [Synechocystis sp.]